jgi:hypothetical protein
LFLHGAGGSTVEISEHCKEIIREAVTESIEIRKLCEGALDRWDSIPVEDRVDLKQGITGYLRWVANLGHRWLDTDPFKYTVEARESDGSFVLSSREKTQDSNSNVQSTAVPEDVARFLMLLTPLPDCPRESFKLVQHVAYVSERATHHLGSLAAALRLLNGDQ